MKRIYSNIGDVRVRGFREYDSYMDIVDQFIDPDPTPEPDIKETPLDVIFAQVFSVNPRTKLPDGDIAVFMNENTHPEVRDFIAKNLMNPNAFEADSSIVDGLTDDDIVRYSRKSGESNSDYARRLYDSIKQSLEFEQINQKNE